MIIINHDNKSEKLNDIRTATSIEAIHTKATELGLIASHTFDMKWIALAETPTSEDIFVAREVDHIDYNGVKYPKRTLLVKLPEFDEEQEITISTQSLSDAMGNDKEVEETEANNLDCEIYFYVEDDVIGMDAEEICDNHLDEPIELVEEVF